MSDQEQEDPSIEEKFSRTAKHHLNYVESYHQTIENLENQLHRARTMLTIHSDAAATFNKLSHLARERITEHHNYLERNQPQPAIAPPRNY